MRKFLLTVPLFFENGFLDVNMEKKGYIVEDLSNAAEVWEFR